MIHLPNPLPLRRFALLLILLSVVWPVHAGEPLEPREDLADLAFRSGERGRLYTRLHVGDRAHYLFCGQGTLEVVSRAVLEGRRQAARYTLLAQIDGARPARELAYRAGAVADADFDGRYRATALRRTELGLGRGCHTVELELARSTTDSVAVRLSFDIRQATRRRWEELEPIPGGHGETLRVGDSRTAYRWLDDGQPNEWVVEGPAWVRFLARPAGQAGPTSYSLKVERGGRTYRTYLLDSAPSRRARLASRPNLAVGRANEVVFALGAGRHRLALRPSPGLELLVRGQMARRDAGPLPGAVAPFWSSRLRLASYYDDNILRYSEKFIERFENGRDPDRFRVESLDDVIQRLDLTVDRDFAGLGGRRAEFTLDVGHRAYSRNSIKDWTRFSASVGQDLGLGRAFELSISWLPGFYVRHLRDSDLRGGGPSVDPFQPFEFDKGDVRLDYSHRLGIDHRARWHLGLASFRHVDAFREFDSDNVFAGLRLDSRLSRTFRLSYALEYTDSAARGWDEEGETLETSDDTDPSYRQWDVMVAARFRLPGKRRSTLFLQAEVGLREYTTDKPASVAPLHNGREDDLLRFYASWQLDLGKGYSLTLFGQLRDRSSTALIEADIGDEKDYEQYELGLRLTARFGG